MRESETGSLPADAALPAHVLQGVHGGCAAVWEARRSVLLGYARRRPYAAGRARQCGRSLRRHRPNGHRRYPGRVPVPRPRRSHPILVAYAQLNYAHPLFSRILLAPDGQNSGSLQLLEIYGSNLASTDLVVLSACQTQLGTRSSGDDIVGLNRAFIYAGSLSVVASLWNMDDQATSDPRLASYRHLKSPQRGARSLSQPLLLGCLHPYW